jgi:hypothetical protein
MRRKGTMFGMEYVVALMKVFTQVGFAIVKAIPFYYSWNCIAPKYLAFIPEIYHHFNYWHVVGIFLVCSYVGEQISKLVPTIVNIKQTVEKKA